ncbi:MAG: COX15/CtaA family protein [Bryobacterales bacterium]|nr:COX15/CtaA family protein [Bryobacterales bacterium]
MSAADLSIGQHFLVRLRILHPLVAVLAAMVVLGVSLGLRRQLRKHAPAERRLEMLLKSWQHTVLLQLVLGVVNIMLAAPGWMQIVHLLVAQILWVLVWVTTLELWPASTAVVAEAEPGPLRASSAH